MQVSWKLPSTVEVLSGSENEPPKRITCHALLRKIPGRREVYAGEWNDTPVIVKRFLDPRRARVHRVREWQGLVKLETLGVSAPKPLFYGATDPAEQIVVIEMIADAVSVKDLFEKAPSADAKTALLSRVFVEISDHHAKGVLQRDLHLGNFLAKGEKLYSLDPAEMQFCPTPIGRREAVRQLAQLGTQGGDLTDETFERLCRQYGQSRDWIFDDRTIKKLHKKRSALQRRTIRKTLKKYQRANSLHRQFSTEEYFAIVCRDFCRGKEIVELLDCLECTFGEPGGDERHCGEATRIITWNKRELEVTCFEAAEKKPWLFGFSRTPARRRWLDAHRCRLLNKPAAKPLAFVEKKKPYRPRRSFIISEPQARMKPLSRDHSP